MLIGCEARILSSYIKLNINYTYPRTIRVQYLRILLSNFGKEDFQRFYIKFAMFKLSMAIILPIMLVTPPFEQTFITHA